MGLRFRKTISILPGVRLNLGKSTASVSVGVPGFRKTFNTKGQVTTTVGLPGTGLYYVDTQTPGKKAKKKQEKEAEKRSAPAAAPAPVRREVKTAAPDPREWTLPARRPISSSLQLTRDNLLSIHKTVDDTIDWHEVSASAEPPDASYNRDMWEYYHGVAPAVLQGDIDTYLSLIYEVNPLDDLLDYGSEFIFGTDVPDKMEVEFTVNESTLLSVKARVRQAEYNNILQDFVCSTAIRAARDIFALLPVERAIVHAQIRDNTVLSVVFDRETMNKIRFGFIDPSETMARFTYNMDYSDAEGFYPVNRIE